VGCAGLVAKRLDYKRGPTHLHTKQPPIWPFLHVRDGARVECVPLGRREPEHQPPVVLWNETSVAVVARLHDAERSAADSTPLLCADLYAQAETRLHGGD
jgi:hypothetical protein